MKKIRMFIFSALLLLSASFALAPSPVVLALTPAQEVCNSIDGTTNCAKNSGVQLDAVIKTIINILSIIVGVAAVIMIVIAGMKYVTSGGDSSNVASAKNTMIYALVGLVVAALAQFIVRFVLKSVTTP